MTSQCFMDLLTVVIFLLIGYSISLAANDDRRCNGTLPNADLDSLCDRRPGSTCTYECRTPYHSIYSPPKILCQEIDLMWSHERLCSVVRCASSFRGGRMSVSCDMYEGSTCAIQCDNMHMATNESLQVTCLSSGRWDRNQTNLCQKDPLCSAYFPNGWISTTCSRREGDTCSINCYPGYSLSSPGMTATCLSSGNWDVDLSNVCRFKHPLCSSYVANGWISITCDRSEGDICSINCYPGYSLSLPGMMATCLSSGSWDVDLSNVCRFNNRDSGSVRYTSSSSANIFIPVSSIAAATIFIVCCIIVCIRNNRCRRRSNVRRPPCHEPSSNSHIATLYTVGQCRIGSDLNRSNGDQITSQMLDASPPPYTEIMKNNRADPHSPPSYEEVHACPSSFLPDSPMQSSK